MAGRPTGTRVMILGWDFKYVDQNGNERETRTAQTLLDEVSYPLSMHTIIDDRAKRNDPLINGLFVPRKEISVPAQLIAPVQGMAPTAPGVLTGAIKRTKEGYGFILPDQGGTDVFFYHLDVLGPDFLDLKPGDRVEFTMGRNEKGPCARQVRRIG
jgi:cold shock CspA family protein